MPVCYVLGEGFFSCIQALGTGYLCACRSCQPTCTEEISKHIMVSIKKNKKTSLLVLHIMKNAGGADAAVATVLGAASPFGGLGAAALPQSPLAQLPLAMQFGESCYSY